MLFGDLEINGTFRFPHEVGLLYPNKKIGVRTYAYKSGRKYWTAEAVLTEEVIPLDRGRAEEGRRVR